MLKYSSFAELLFHLLFLNCMSSIISFIPSKICIFSFSADAFLTVDEENIIVYYKRRNGKGEFGGPKVRMPEGGAQTPTNEKQAELVAGGNA